jgi:hypothetical protein
METSLKIKIINALSRKLLDSQDLRYGVDENPSLSAIRSVESTVGAYHWPLFFLVGSLPFVENMHVKAPEYKSN